MSVMEYAAVSYAALAGLGLCLVLAAGVALAVFEGLVWSRRCPVCKYPMAKVWATDRFYCQKCGWEG